MGDLEPMEEWMTGENLMDDITELDGITIHTRVIIRTESSTLFIHPFGDLNKIRNKTWHQTLQSG
jgi:hypothetical protein